MEVRSANAALEWRKLETRRDVQAGQAPILISDRPVELLTIEVAALQSSGHGVERYGMDPAGRRRRQATEIVRGEMKCGPALQPSGGAP